MTDISLENLGATPQEAIRVILREFRSRGWRDDGSVVRLVRFLGSKETASSAAVAHQISGEFLVTNGVTRSAVAQVLSGLNSRHR